MSFSDDFYEELNKKKKKKQNASNNAKESGTKTKSDFSSKFYSALGDSDAPVITAAASVYDDDIAPVRKETTLAESALSDPDFQRYSSLGAAVKNPSFKDATKGISIAGWRPFADDIQNPVTYVRENEMEVRLLGDNLLDGIDFLWANMTDEEVEVYNYYLAKDGKDKAKRYLESLKKTLSEREGKKISNNINGNSVAEVIIGGLAGVESGVKGVTVGMKNLITGSEETMTPSPMQYADRMMAEDNTGLMMAAHDTASAIGNMTPSLAVGLFNPIAGAATMGVGVAGNKYNSMIEEGYETDEARGSAVINGILEGASQYFLGGIGKLGGKGASAVFSKIAPKAAGRIAETIAKVAGKTPRILQAVGHASVEMGKEATEEALQTYLEPLVDSWVTGEEFEAPEFEEVVYSALLGAVTSGVLEGAPAVGKATVDTITGKPKLTAPAMTENEQKVVDKVVGDEIARREAAGETLTAKDKSKIHDTVVEQMEHGQIDTDTIEEVLGGDSYKTYRDTVTREDALRGEYEELGGLENPTLAQQTRYQELHNNRETFVNDDMRNDLLSKAKEDVRKRVSGSRLEESYLEEERVHQKLDLDASKYEGVARKTVENAIRMGANNTANSRSFVEFSAKISEDTGLEVDYGTDKDFEATRAKLDVDRVNESVSRTKITLNTDSEYALNDLLGHAITHKTEKAKHYAKLQKAFKDFIGEEAYNAMLREKSDTYKNAKGSSADNEITATLSGKYLFTDEKFIKKLSVEHQDVFHFVLDEIKHWIKMATAGSKEARQLEQIQHLYQKCYREAFAEKKAQGQTASAGKNYSLVGKNADGQDVYVSSPEVMEMSMSDRIKKFRNDFLADFKGRTAKFERNGHTYYARFVETAKGLGKFAYEGGSKSSPSGLKAKIRLLADGNIFELVEDSTYYDSEKERGKQTQAHKNAEYWDYYYKTVVVDGKGYDVYIDIRNDVESGDYQNKEQFVYSIRFEDNKNVATSVTTPATQNSEVGVNLDATTEDSIAPIPENVNNKMSNSSDSENEVDQFSLSSMANTFYGDENMSAVAFEESDYRQTDGYKNYVNQCLNNMRQSRADFDEPTARKEIEDQIDGIVRVALAAKKAGYDIYDDPNKRSKTDSKNRLLFSSLEPNSEYTTSNDVSTICDKRKNFAEIYDDIVRAEEAKGVPKGKRFFDNVDNYFYLHKVLAEKGLTQPCRQCYVESMRKNLAPMANAFLRLVNETDVNNKANDQLYQPSGKNKGQLKTSNAELRERVLETFEAHPEYGMSVGDLTVETLTTADGLAQLKIQAPLIYEAFNSFYGQSKPKMPKSATPFRFGELTALLTDHNGKIKQSLVDKINSTGGFRLQSYSDFQTENYTDVLQAIFEAGTLGLNGHAYTKVPAFLEATEGTNLKRNISIFMYKDGNEWKIDRNDSFPYTLEEIYDIVNSDASGNTSIIAVSQNKEMSAWIMANDYVGQGIPFHKSGMKMGTVRDTDVKTEDGRIIKGYSGTIDHTKQQTEVWAKANADHKALTKVKKGIDIYSFWDFDNTDNLSKNELIEKNLKAYIDACEEAGYLPKFRDYVMNNGTVLNDVLKYSKELGFVSQDATIDDISFEYKGYRIPYGYYKFLGDFGMFKPDGTASPHDTLSLDNYDFDKAEQFFADAESLRRSEILQQFANGEERQKYRESGLDAGQLDEIIHRKRQEVVDEIVAPVQNSLSNEGYPVKGGGDMPAPVGNYYVYGKDIKYTPQEDIAPVSTNTPTTQANTPTVGETIAEKPAVPTSERIADGRRSDELLLDSLDNHPVQTIEQKIEEKIRALHGEIADIKDLRREKWDDYESRIADLRAKYNSKKNKNTKEAIGILQSISRLERMKASDDADFSKRISDREARVERMNDPKYARAMRKHAKMEADAKWAADLLGDTSTWVDKKLGLQYATNTERRNLRDIVRDANGNEDIAHADAIDDALNGQYNRDEASKKRELAKVRDKYAKLKITRAEDAYIQMLGEFRHNPDTTLTEEDIKEYYEKHKGKIDTEKVDKVIEMARQDYDDFLNRVNAELKKQGMKEIPYRQGYFPHFTEPKQNFIQKLLNWKTQDNEIPTSIAGLTETFKPTKSWQSFDKQRHSDETDFSFMKGFDSYSEGALDWIYHMDTLQKRRAVENHIRYTHSDEGIRDRIKEVYANEEIDANEAQAQIEHILSEAKNPLNNFVQDFTTHTNILAGKKNSLDRTVEQWTNRHIYSVMTNVQNRMSANMVLANVRSALTNFIPITQSWAQVSPIRSLQAAKETIANSFKDDGTVDKSTFLTNRLREVDRLYQTNWDKVLDKAGIMFEIVDNFSSQVIWRSKYNQNLADGMSEAEAIRNADQFSENVMAGRSKGNEPTLFNAKNPFVKAFTMFQLEVNNQYGYLFKDVPHDLKAETNHWKFNLAKGYTTAFIGAYVYNALFEKLTGGEAALDPIGIIEELLRDLGLFDDDEEKEPDKVVTNLVDNVVEELPFVGGLFGGGRIPISSALPYSDDGLTGFIGDVSEGNWGNIGKEMMNPLLNVGLPVGGGQLKKTYQGLNMFSDDHPVSGSYTDSGKLRFPVEDTPLNRVQAAVFGQYASKNAREYFDNDYAPLSEKQIQEYIDVDMPIKDYWEYREGLKGKTKAEEKMDYISGLDLPTYKKNILANNVLDRKEPVDLENYDDFGSLEEFDFATKNPGKHAFAKSVGGYSSYQTYSKAMGDIHADKDASGKSINGSRKEKVIAYINNLNADYYTKILLLKSEYPSEDTYNSEIVNYINNRSDLSYDERVALLTELGFKVAADGQIYDMD